MGRLVAAPADLAPGRVQDLVVRFATEIRGWGYAPIRGALANLGHEVGRNTIKRILLDQGLEPAPIRGKRMPRRTFLQAHLGVIAAMDFFAVEVRTVSPSSTRNVT